MSAINTLITDNLAIWTDAIERKNGNGRGSSKKIELYGIQKLKTLVLDLAVRGKLIPPDPSDEPASELLRQINEEKKKLTAEGKIKKTKKLPTISNEEMLFKIPSHWAWIRLGDATNYGQADKAEPGTVNEDTWVLELEDVEKQTSKLLAKIRHSERQFRSSKNQFQAGDVIYSKLRPYLDKVIVADESGVCTTEMIPIRGYFGINSEYLRLFLKSPFFVKYASDSSHGMNLPRLGTDKGQKALFALPPAEEQKRIVAKVDELMALCEQLEAEKEASLTAHQQLVINLLATLTNSNDAEELAENWQRLKEHFDMLFTTPESVDALKQTILQLAVMGKLVPQDPAEEPASELLKKIHTEKKRLVEDGKIRRDKKLPPIIDIDKPFSLPEGWQWVRFPEIGIFERGKSKHRPRNDPMLFSPGVYPLVQTGEVARAGEIIQEFHSEYSEIGLQQSKLWPEGTLCITIAANIADTAILGFDACFPDSVVGFVPLSPIESPRYFLHFMKTAKADLLKYAPSTAQKNINLGILETVLIPLPPLEEQQRITSRVDELLSLCNSLTSRFNETEKIKIKLADAVGVPSSTRR